MNVEWHLGLRKRERMARAEDQHVEEEIEIEREKSERPEK